MSFILTKLTTHSSFITMPVCRLIKSGNITLKNIKILVSKSQSIPTIFLIFIKLAKKLYSYL